MSLIGFFSRLRRKRKRIARPLDTPRFYCGGCDGLILEDEMGYDPETGMLYHPGRCSVRASGRISERSRHGVAIAVSYIDRDYAVGLFRDRRLVQKPGAGPACFGGGGHEGGTGSGEAGGVGGSVEGNIDDKVA